MTNSARHALTSVPTGEAASKTAADSAEAQPMRPPTWLHDAVTRLADDARLDRVSGAMGPTAQQLSQGTPGDVLHGKWLGHALHPLLTDIPMGCWLSAGILDLVGGRPSRRAAQRLVAAGLLAVPLTAASGMADWSGIEEQGRRRVGAAHAVGNTAVALLYAMSWNARRKRRHARGVALAMGGAALSWATGYLGGHLSFGSDEGDDDGSHEEPTEALVDLTGVTHEEHGFVAGYPTAPDEEGTDRDRDFSR